MRPHKALADDVVCPPPDLIPAVQFYSIEIAPCADGTFHVGIRAAICEGDGELESMDLGRAQVRTRAQMLDAVNRAIAAHQFGRRQ